MNNMKLEFRNADRNDAPLLISIYNDAFYQDYLRYGECPGYGKTLEMMERSINRYPKFIIYCDGKPVGCISCHAIDPGIYEVGCLCIIPEYQGKGIGTRVFQFARQYYNDWKAFTLITPADKEENVKFYTEKCGFSIRNTEKDANVTVVRFYQER